MPMLTSAEATGKSTYRSHLYQSKETEERTTILSIDNSGGTVFLHCDREGLEKLMELCRNGLTELDIAEGMEDRFEGIYPPPKGGT